ncbi:MAG: anti-sigma factor family protein [Bryobacteraceae bacterium]
MSCHSIKSALCEYVDQRLTEEMRAEVAAHLGECRHCAFRHDEMVRLCESLRAVPAVQPPKRLRVDLQLIASRERLRMLAKRSFSSRVEYMTWRLRLVFENMMRPLALPFAGGLVSAVFLFSALMPSLGFQRNVANDVSTPLYQEAGIYAVPAIPRVQPVDDILVEVEIDSQGRVVDYNVSDGEINGEIGNLILFTTFTPAKMFGQPTGGRILLRRSRIVVKG